MRIFSKLYNYSNGIYECVYYKACSKQPKVNISLTFYQLVQFFPVQFNMHLEAALVRETFPTLAALKRLVFPVHSKVLYVITFLYEGFATNTA
jgi:hypothetical protein